MANVQQHRLFHGIILRDACISLGVEPTQQNINELKLIFKKYLKVYSVSALSDANYSKMIAAVTMLMAREMGKEIPLDFAEKTMRQILTETTRDYG